MMKLLKVPFYTQEKEDTCSLAVTRMLVEYHLGKKLHENEIENHIKRIDAEDEFHIANNAIYLDGLGLKTEIFCYDLIWIFSDKHIGLGRKKLELEIKNWITHEPKKRKYRRPYLEYLIGGGRLRIQVPSGDLLEKEIDQDNPTWVLVESRHFFGDIEDDESGHSVLVVGYDDRYFYIHDPLDPQKSHAKGKNAKIHKEVLVYCWYRRFGNTLVVKK